VRRLAPALVAAACLVGCDRGVDADDAKAYFTALEAQTEYVVNKANGICADSSALSQHAAIQGLLRDLNQYRIDFEGQMRCTQKDQCAAPDKKATPPPVFRAEPGAPDPKGAELSKATFARLRSLVAGKPPKPFRDKLLLCQTEAMAVAASAAVLVTKCTTQPGSEAHKLEQARLAGAQKSFAEAMKQARSAVP
jgi:hypothetical protein